MRTSVATGAPAFRNSPTAAWRAFMAPSIGARSTVSASCCRASFELGALLGEDPQPIVHFLDRVVVAALRDLGGRLGGIELGPRDELLLPQLDAPIAVSKPVVQHRRCSPSTWVFGTPRRSPRRPPGPGVPALPDGVDQLQLQRWSRWHRTGRRHHAPRFSGCAVHPRHPRYAARAADLQHDRASAASRPRPPPRRPACSPFGMTRTVVILAGVAAPACARRGVLRGARRRVVAAAADQERQGQQRGGSGGQGAGSRHGGDTHGLMGADSPFSTGSRGRIFARVHRRVKQ